MKFNFDLKNKLLPHHGHETTKHFIIKAMVFKILFDRRYYVHSECEFKKGKISDIYALKCGGEKLVVEIETKPTKKHNKELKEFYHDKILYIIDVGKISNDITKMKEEIKKILDNQK